MSFSEQISKVLNVTAPKLPTPPDLSAIVACTRWRDAYYWGLLIRQFYPTAVQAEFETEAEYNDEHSYSDRVTRVIVYDAETTDISDTLTDERMEEFRESWWEVDTPCYASLHHGIHFDTPSLGLISKGTLRNQLTEALIAVDDLPEQCFHVSTFI